MKEMSKHSVKRLDPSSIARELNGPFIGESHPRLPLAPFGHLVTVSDALRSNTSHFVLCLLGFCHNLEFRGLFVRRLEAAEFARSVWDLTDLRTDFSRLTATMVVGRRRRKMHIFSRRW